MRSAALAALLALGCNAITDFDRFHPASDAAAMDGGRRDAGPPGTDTGVRDAFVPDGRVVCGVDQADCDGDGEDCETDLSLPESCGACSMRCATPTPVCGGEPGARRCTIECPIGRADCDAMPANGCEVDLATDEVHCGACPTSCAAGQYCLAGGCGYGDGSGGPLDVTDTTSINGTRATASGAMGSRMLGVGMVTAPFAPGDLVLIHQTVAPVPDPVGYYEYARVAEVMTGQLVLETPLVHTYADDATHHAQVVRVEQRTTVTVVTGATLTAPAWNGFHGGILAIDARDTVSVLGTGRIAMDALGFRGDSHDCAGGGARCDPTMGNAPGKAGESHRGPARDGLANNATGGGGAQRGDHNGGGGGAYGAVGSAGTFMGLTGCFDGGGAPSGGERGLPEGSADLGVDFLFGGAGGEGGRSSDASGEAGRGGNGGGAILIRAASFALTGFISADGEVGEGSCATCCMGVAPTTMGAGGGGGGGAILLVAGGTADIGAARVHARGGTGGRISSGTVVGGRGGEGRITVRAAAVVGTSDPAAAP